MISDVTSEEEEEDRAPTPNNSINKNMNIKVYKNMAQWACKKKKKKKKTTTTTIRYTALYTKLYSLKRLTLFLFG